MFSYLTKKMKIDVHECVCVCVCGVLRDEEEKREEKESQRRNTRRNDAFVRSFVLFIFDERTYVYRLNTKRERMKEKKRRV